MAQAALKPWTVDAFFAWDERQEGRHELVGGFPLRMMAGVSNVHDIIVVNLLAELRGRLRGGPCRPFTGESALETYAGQIRRPDAGVDCGPYDGRAYKATQPRVVVEVLSPSTRDFDSLGKLAEYQAVATLDHILFVEPNESLVILWSRGRDGWSQARVEGLETSVELPALGISLPMAEIYDGVSFPEPRMVPPAG